MFLNALCRYLWIMVIELQSHVSYLALTAWSCPETEKSVIFICSCDWFDEMLSSGIYKNRMGKQINSKYIHVDISF